MTALINASTSSGVVVTSDTSGSLAFQSNGTTIMTVASTGVSTQVGSPAFSAYAGSAQSITNSTYTKIQLNTETFDTNNNFDSSTNYRFTPTVAGYYQINANVYLADAGVAGYIISALYKNGSAYKYSIGYYNASYGNGGAPISDVIYLNGSTDYIEYYVRQTNLTSSTFALSATSQGTYMSGAMIRSA